MDICTLLRTFVISSKLLVMDYGQNHLRDWLKERPCLSIGCIERTCNMTKGTLRHFINERRGVPEKFIAPLIKELSRYGYVPMDEE